MNNIDGVLEIVGGLTHNSVERMKLTWNVCIRLNFYFFNTVFISVSYYVYFVCMCKFRFYNLV
jgi:hypothetical protein